MRVNKACRSRDIIHETDIQNFSEGFSIRKRPHFRLFMKIKEAGVCMMARAKQLAVLLVCCQWRIQDSWTGGADILLPPPAPPLLLSSLLLPLIPPLYFLDVQACRGGWRTPSPHARSAPGPSYACRPTLISSRNLKVS